MKFKHYCKLIAPLLPAVFVLIAATTSLALYEPTVYKSESSSVPIQYENSLVQFDVVTMGYQYSLQNLQEDKALLMDENGTLLSAKDILEAENLALKSKKTTVKTASVKESSEEDEDTLVTYTDGTYTGTGKGFRGTTKVQVVIKNKKIDSIEMLSHEDDEAFMNKAKALIPEIMKKQSTKVDTISGATYSSKGILRAVKKALLKAEGEDVEDEVAETTTKPVTVGKGSFPFVDGTYQGEGKGFKGTIKLSVTMKDSTISSIEVLSSNDDASYFKKASTILDLVLANQTLQVDTVSGATYSSKGIKEALQNAMKAAAMKSFDLVDSSTTNKNPTTNPKEPTKESRETTQESTEETNKESTEETTSETQESHESPSNALFDGTYTGTATCYSQDGISFEDYQVTLSLTISGGKVSELSATTTADAFSDAWFMDAFLGDQGNNGMKAKLLALSDPTQTSGVDVVSGATCSSESILQAYQDAIKKAKAGGTHE